RRRQQAVGDGPLDRLLPEPVVVLVAGLEPPPPGAVEADVEDPAEPVVLPGDQRRGPLREPLRLRRPGLRVVHPGEHLRPVLRLADGGPPVRRQAVPRRTGGPPSARDRKSTRLNSSHVAISYAVFCLKKKKK